jgi:DNA polymerase I-like protein with 3'-5' exonuclease and polymerase domains
VERQPDGTSKVLAAGLRDIFVARPGSWIVELDYDRLELYVVGVLAGDPIIKKWMTTPGVDAHTENAIALFGTCDKQLRSLAKQAVYNINYGNTNYDNLSKGLFETLKADYPNITLSKVTHIVTTWFSVHHWIATWRAKELDHAKRFGFTEEPISGRRRYWYGEPKDTEVYNFPIQTLAGHLTARAIIEIDKSLDWESSGMLFQCHDSIVLEGPDPIKLYRICKAAMEAPIEIHGEKFSFPASCKVGLDWGSARECAGEKEIEAAWRKAQDSA